MTRLPMLLLAVLLTSVACATEPPSPETPYEVVATTAMIGDVVAAVAGDRARVTTLIGAGIDPHQYRASRNDVRRLMQADVVFYNGLNLEGKMSDTFVQVARTGKPVHAVTERVDETFLIMDAESEHADPHLWMDPAGWIKATEVITEVLAAFDQAYAETYRTRGAAYTAELRKLHEYAGQRIETIPEASRMLVTAHDAFNYMARAYGIQVRGIQGISTESQAGLKTIETLIATIVERRVAAVFTESSVSDKNIQALIEGARARGHELQIGGELFSDAMGDPGTYEGTYVGMIDHNVTTIVRALGGTAPPRGMQGKLKGEEPPRE